MFFQAMAVAGRPVGARRGVGSRRRLTAGAGCGRPGGVEALGQNMLVLIGFAALLAVVLIPPAGAGAGIYLLLERPLGYYAAVPAAAALLGLAAVEGMVMVRWLGRVFERLDPSTTAAQA